MARGPSVKDGERSAPCGKRKGGKMGKVRTGLLGGLRAFWQSVDFVL